MTRELNSERLHVMVTPSIKRDIERACLARGISEAGLVREALLKCGYGAPFVPPPVPDMPFDFLSEAEALVASAPAEMVEHRIVGVPRESVSRDALQPRVAN